MTWVRVKIGDGEWQEVSRPALITADDLSPAPVPTCPHRGEPTGKSVKCPTCRGGQGTDLKTFVCSLHGVCTIDPLRPVEGVHCCGSRIIPDSPPTDMTFVWIYWHGGAKADELRWSIRSVEKHYHGKPSILVAGSPPPWYVGPEMRIGRVLPCRMRRYRDQLNKLHAVCMSDAVPESFVWMMDDTLFTSRVTIADIERQFFHGNVPAAIRGSGEWNEHKRETFAALAKEGLPQVDYCTHMPHLIEKKKFLSTWNRFDLANRPLQWELLYGAMHWHRRERIDRQVFAYLGSSAKAVPAAAIVNHANKAWTPKLQAALRTRFPDTSPHETTALRLKQLRTEPRMRTGLLALIDALPPGPLTMAEVGSYAGESAEIFAASGKFAAIHCVDSWTIKLSRDYRTADAEPAFDAVAARHPDVIRKHKADSVQCAKTFGAGTLDLVYIDAAHDYESIRADIAAWRPKVKPGGLVCGHDFSLWTPGVIQAVREAFASVSVIIFQDDSWMVRI